MSKMIFTLAAFLMMALVVLSLRHHRLELSAQIATLHDQVLDKQWQLRDQTVLIATRTNPIQLSKNLKAAGMVASPTTQPGLSGGAVPVLAPVPVGRRGSAAYAMSDDNGVGGRRGRHETP